MYLWNFASLVSQLPSTISFMSGSSLPFLQDYCMGLWIIDIIHCMVSVGVRHSPEVMHATVGNGYVCYSLWFLKRGGEETAEFV